MRPLVRDAARDGPALTPLGVPTDSADIVVGHITDPESMRSAVADCDAVVHSGGVFTYDSREHARVKSVHLRGTETVLGEAVRAGADPCIYLSSIAGFLGSNTPPVTPCALGVRPRPLKDTIFDSVRWLYEAGHITADEAGLAARGVATTS